jgi:hypothetical protein
MIKINEKGLVDQYGDVMHSPKAEEAHRELLSVRRQLLKARYDAAQTVQGNELHWKQADNLDPHGAASPVVRRTLRSRSRYEIVENNPFLKGTVLTIASDFVGAGPKLQITDKRLSKDRRQIVEKQFSKWFRKRRIRQKLWRARMAKITDGETFLRAYSNKKKKYPVRLDFQVLEADRCSSFPVASGGTSPDLPPGQSEIDGIRFDKFEEPTKYHILTVHPSNSAFHNRNVKIGDGDWIDEKFIIHWFRQDRGWLRGIPELTPGLPLCAILRRYTLAMVRWAETQADFTAVIESDGPPGTNPWSTEDDDPFESFPLQMGLITNMPWGYKMKQMNAVPLGAQYDEFVGSVLREITRPLLTPYNIAAGTSKDSNMASGVLDQAIYKGGQTFERMDCDEVVLDKMLDLWWAEAVRITGHLGDDLLRTDRIFADEPPDHKWRWDRIGLDHTDPSRIARYLTDMGAKGAHYLTDRDIQEIWFNRDVEEWREEVDEDTDFRSGLALPPEDQPTSSAPLEEEED